MNEFFEQNIIRERDKWSRSVCPDLISKVVKFIEVYKKNVIEENRLQLLDFISGVLLGERKEVIITWFPRYRCALIAKLDQGCFRAPVRHLTLLGLSKHQLQLQHEWNNEAEQTVKPTGYDVRPSKPVKSENYPQFMAYFKKAFRDCPYTKMSPAFVEWVLAEAHQLLNGGTVNIRRPLKGGWSEVLDHNGGEWPLLSAVVEYLAASSPHSSDSQHQHFVCHLQMNILDSTKKELLPLIRNPGTSYNLTVNYVDKIMIMMETIARKATEELSGIYSIKDVEKFLSDCRQQVDESLAKRWDQHAGLFRLPNLCDYAIKHWSVKIDDAPKNTQTAGQYQKILQLSRSNIGLLPITTVKDIIELIKYVEFLEGHTLKDTAMVLSLVVTTIENFVFSLSSHLSDSSYCVDIVAMEKLVNKYRLWNREFLECMGKNAIRDLRPGLVVELLSKEMLVMWVGFALVHNTLKQKIPILNDYGVSLNWESVSHLVLSKKFDQRAALEVSAYLKSNSKTNNELFNLSGNQETTLKFASHYASGSPELKQIWEKEQKAADRREEDRWREIERKKREVERLEQQLRNQNDERDCLYSRRSSFHYWSEKYDDLTYDIKCLNSKISSTESSLSRERNPPDPIFQPLPRDQHQALRILFFLHMPDELQLLARMAISAQQILCPVGDFCQHSALDTSRIAEIDQRMRQQSLACTSWVTYYNGHSPTVASSQTILFPYSIQEPPKPSQVGPKTVKNFISKSQCVWHPDSLQPVILWNGGGFSLDNRGGKFFDPFIQIDTNSIVEYFTEKFDRNIQFTLTQFRQNTDPIRSNQAIANQKLKPSCLKKPEWLTFASLRAYPNQQLRKLCSILNDRSLPLNEPIVHTLLRQTLYHLGEVEFRGNEVFPVWKTDMLEGEFLSVMFEELASIGDEIALKPSQQQCMLMLIEITRFVAQWSDKCVSLLRKFAETIEAWIKSCDAQIEKAHVNDLPTLRAKKGVFYHYATFCYSSGKLSNDDVTKLLQSLVNAQNESKFKDEPSYNEQLRTMIQIRCKIMGEIVTDVVENVMKDPLRRMLTEAIRKIISHTPEKLNWANISCKNGLSCCFEARDTSNNLYSINVLNGIVLYNGVPPSQLPTTVLTCPLYKRSFGDRNFETCSSGNVMKTVKTSHDFYYWFCLQESELIVTEKYPQMDCELVMLDSCSLPNQGSWGYDLPIILKKNYSHWYCARNKVIVFRGREFFHRDVDFILELTGNQWHCYRIPSHRKKKIWSEYLIKDMELEKTFDELVKIESPTLEILQKFEAKKYIHCFKSAEGLIRYHYTRFDLEFYFDPKLTSNCAIKLQSRDYTGYQLSAGQQFHDTLLGFERYLVLEHKEYGTQDTKIIIPQGDILKGSCGITVQTEDKPDSKLKVYTYDVHPRFHSLTATSIHARIHLADLYAACTTLAPEGRMRMCGSEVAMQLVRRSWTNQPLEMTDYIKLKTMCKHTNFTPGLELLCYEVASSSLQTEFLHTHKPEVTINERILAFPEAASVEYVNEDDPRNARKSLTSDEEIRVLGKKKLSKTKKIVILENSNSKCCANCIQKQKDESQLLERSLLFMMRTVINQEADFVFGDNSFNTNDFTDLYKHMIQKLEESHVAFARLTKTALKTEYKDTFNSLLEQIVSKRKEIESSLFDSLTSVSDHCGHRAVNFRILRSVNVYPILALEDLVRCAIDREWMNHFNPFLSQDCSDVVYHNLLLWMKYCVLEDKMMRLLRLARNCETSGLQGQSKNPVELQIIQELAVDRSWSAEQHPEWLAFEVIAQLQIRPIQYTVAQSLIDGVDYENNNQGPITQLNMGEGKTRVILPMLAMHWKNSDNVVRFNFLSALLQEAGEYLHNVLSATVINIRVFHFPFNRDVHLSPETAETFYYSLKYCYKSGGVVLCAPEHRQSLKLKWYELKVDKLMAHKVKEQHVESMSMEVESNGMEIDLKPIELDETKSLDVNNKVCETLTGINSIGFLDILDEVDEILRTRNKLIYAVGSHEFLPSKESRLNVLQGLLRTIGSSDKIREILSKPKIIKGEVGEVQGRFLEFQIIPGKDFEDIQSSFMQSLMAELMNNPPFELRWMKLLKLTKGEVVDYATKPEVSALSWENIETSCHDDILALRGFLAGGMFVHCLMKRNRVDYGVRRSVGRRKKLMAVPFRACETPSLRSEFGHPDCATMFTCLSYYYDGLNSDQVQEAFRTLLLLGDSAQASVYGDWFQVYQQDPNQMESNHHNLLNKVTKIDLSNAIMIGLLFRYFSKNMKTINFWLNNCVFPVETMQFPYRLEATAWDIANNSANTLAGFSGTNDDRLIMPSSLKWVEQTNLSLIGTDGKMLHLLQKSNLECIQIPRGKPQWQVVLETVIQRASKDVTHRTCALIDAGALMAGATDNKSVAMFLANRLDKGVFYFDIARNGWWVRDKLGRAWPKHSSPIHERDGFVYFDESRTRGADMKLNINSCAVLTLGPEMCKDKLMQAAGRMRMLEHGQKLHLIATQDVASKIRSVNRLHHNSILTPVHVLRWVMNNTVHNVARWLPEWAIQGGNFFLKEKFQTEALIPDIQSLKDMYGNELQERPVCQVWEQKRAELLKRNDRVSLNEKCFEEIDSRIGQYGKEYYTKLGSNLDEECERELEKEIEVEEEVEREITPRRPFAEISWNVNNFLNCRGVSELNPVIQIHSLKSFIDNNIFFVGKSMKDYEKNSFSWPQNIYGTVNFFHTVEKSALDKVSSANDYLRLVDSFLVFPTGDVLLISEKEADSVLKLTWTTECRNFVMLSLTYARKGQNAKSKITLQAPSTTFGNFQVSDKVLAALALFQGLVMYPKDEEKEAILEILSGDFSKQKANIFSEMRGLDFSYPRSDLQTICTLYNVN